jgi:UDP-2,4-diacetamido-2,4,6-trideoxy-beta-L-altropyranose hydrolase
VFESTLLIRADASAAMGTGHVMRCLALAQAWQDFGGHCVFCMAQSTPAVERRLLHEKMELAPLTAEAASAADAAQTVDIAREKNAAWIVVDGYQFRAEYQRAVKAAGLKLLFIDDNVHAENYCADLVLNQNIHARESLYANREPFARLLLGPRYAMLRRDFRPWRNWQREISATGRKILVTMGGSDPNNLTAKVLEAILELSDLDLETVVLVGGSNPHLRSVERLIQSFPRKNSIRLVVDAPSVPEQMAWADVAVAGAGTTFWEMCFLGLPSLLLVLADNQKGVASAANKLGIAWSMGNGAEIAASDIAAPLANLLHDPDTRASQSANGRKLIDGRGAQRVLAFLSGLQWRRTMDSDCKLFWEWANEPGARAASFRNKCISWEHHEKWFRAKMEDPRAILYTATNAEGVPFGEVRCQVEGKRAVLSISLAAAFRGRQYGQKILTLALEEFFSRSEIDFIDAYVKPSNEASLKLFAAAGFQRYPPKVIEGQEAVHFALEKSALA